MGVLKVVCVPVWDCVFAACAGAPTLAASPPHAFPGTTTKATFPSQRRCGIFLIIHDVESCGKYMIYYVRVPPPSPRSTIGDIGPVEKGWE
jgi:hypothetical protein